MAWAACLATRMAALLFKVESLIESVFPRYTPLTGVLASLKLTDQGRELLEKGRLDDAIRILEQAINLNSSNGQNYYYLAEAWILKGVLRQASEFNRLAEQYLRGDQAWEDRVLKQRERILEKTL